MKRLFLVFCMWALSSASFAQSNSCEVNVSINVYTITGNISLDCTAPITWAQAQHTAEKFLENMNVGALRIVAPIEMPWSLVGSKWNFSFESGYQYKKEAGVV